MNNGKKIADFVSIVPYYQKSINLINDIENDAAIEGYICQETAKRVLSVMIQQILHTNQKSFTWTGPFGSGKSSLALALANYLTKSNPNKNVVELANIDGLFEAFPKSSKNWKVIPIVGNKLDPQVVLESAISKITKSTSITETQLFHKLEEITKENDGLLIIFDEMGKFLEGNHQHNNIYFFQELAEFVNRSNQNIVIIGILHQAFRQYAKRLNLSEKNQNEWDKIQGRFTDIPVITSSYEMVELISEAINYVGDINKISRKVCEQVTKLLRERNKIFSTRLTEKLEKCWPLHPITSLLLGPASKKQYGQNERSIFSFLNSFEFFGFQDFLYKTESDNNVSYTPDMYWDYLETNMEPAIIASMDSQRWISAKSCIERAAEKGSLIHIKVVKTIAVIDLFKNNIGIISSTNLLKTIFFQVKNLKTVLLQLQNWKIIIFRKFSQAWTIFEGSDFDLNQNFEKELKKVIFDIDTIDKIIHLQPIIAKKHLYKTGSLRWMDIVLASNQTLLQKVEKFCPNQSRFGQFILLLDCEKIEEKNINKIKKINNNSIVGIPKNHLEIYDLTKEILALSKISTNPHLEGDQIARREISERIKFIIERIKNEVLTSLHQINWYLEDINQANSQINIYKYCSILADSIFNKCPKIISELINRDKLSNNGTQARKSLLYRMLASEQTEYLNIQGFSAEKSLYLSCLQATNLHTQIRNTDRYEFSSKGGNDKNIVYLWKQTLSCIVKKNGKVNVSEIYEMWRTPPYGIKEGLLPILFWTFFLSHKSQLAIYKDKFYLADIEEIVIDESLQNIARLEIQNIDITNERSNFLKNLTSMLYDIQILKIKTDSSLDTARALVSTIYKLPGWTKTTRMLSANSIKLRDELKRASDPYKVIFHDIKAIYKTDDKTKLIDYLQKSLVELTKAYPNLLDELSKLLKQELDDKSVDWSELNNRAKNIKNTADNFYNNSLISRLCDFDGTIESKKDFFSLLAEKQINQWSDSDVLNAKGRIVEFAQIFRKLEIISHIYGKDNSQREAIALIYSSPKTKLFESNIEVNRKIFSSLNKYVLEITHKLSYLSNQEKLSVIISVLETFKENENG
ncbi:ATP-binding protein [Snodgrassella alvi]|uniref:ATP-binding protein n=1 Tax=Snodgrassella alvi TaxID=1196083 RepID=UPI002740C644|nr:ATP-binding protein [Snodgrassella alvi]WLT02096.1 ATP-binding protein [Snodgrassella alvi]